MVARGSLCSEGPVIDMHLDAYVDSACWGPHTPRPRCACNRPPDDPPLFLESRERPIESRRDFLKQATLGGGALTLGGLPAVSGAEASGLETVPQAAALYEKIATYGIDDTHCHPLTDKDAETTAERFLRRLSLAAFPAVYGGYFPRSVYKRWRDGNADTRGALNEQYGVAETLEEITYHVGKSVFVKAMVKEMAGFLGCEPSLEAVIEARNDRGRRDYWGYVNALFADAGIENVMIDTGYSEGMEAEGIARFEEAIAPATSRRIYRVEDAQWGSGLMEADLSFEEMEARFRDGIRAALDADGNYGRRSYGMKSYALPGMGVLKPLHDAAIAERAWEAWKADRDRELTDRAEWHDGGREITRYLLTLAMEACLERKMPMQFHAGNGEAPSVILRNQDPYYLEEMVRFDKDGWMRRPKVIPVHAGYPLVGKAAWLSHLYTNCYFELSIMTPLVHHGLVRRYLQVMEVVPVSKILFGSDAYHLPELYWLAARWGRKYLSQALAVYVEHGLLSMEEALGAARMILNENNRRVYDLTGTA